MSAGATPFPAPGPEQATDAERLARLALSRLTEPGDLRVASLVCEVGAVELHAQLLHDQDPAGLLTDAEGRLAALAPERDLEQAARLGARFVVPGDAEWPQQVDQLDGTEPVAGVGGAPLGLWVRGPLRLDELDESVALVGSRACTTYGEDVARGIATAVARSGRVVVSGGAVGIDQAAHRGALAGGGRTVAVLACGVDRVYPSAHRDLLEHVRREGAVVSELAPGCAPLRHRFLVRNRVIASLATGTVVVEAALRSGALNTATWASRLNRVLMGVPGPTTSVSSSGVHQLLRTGAASVVGTGPEVLELVAPVGAQLLAVPRAPDGPRDRLTSRERRVLDAVPRARPARADAVSRVAGVGLLETRGTLGALERHGLVVLGEGGWRLAAPPAG